MLKVQKSVAPVIGVMQCFTWALRREDNLSSCSYGHLVQQPQWTLLSEPWLGGETISIFKTILSVLSKLKIETMWI